jgi:hypothetical protein
MMMKQFVDNVYLAMIGAMIVIIFFIVCLVLWVILVSFIDAIKIIM